MLNYLSLRKGLLLRLDLHSGADKNRYPITFENTPTFTQKDAKVISMHYAILAGYDYKFTQIFKYTRLFEPKLLPLHKQVL